MYMEQKDRIILSDTEKDIIRKLNHHTYTVEFLEKWMNCNATVEKNIDAAIQRKCLAYGFYAAVRAMIIYTGGKI